jgi:hypothetical protein
MGRPTLGTDPVPLTSERERSSIEQLSSTIARRAQVAASILDTRDWCWDAHDRRQPPWQCARASAALFLSVFFSLFAADRIWPGNERNQHNLSDRI